MATRTLDGFFFGLNSRVTVKSTFEGPTLSSREEMLNGLKRTDRTRKEIDAVSVKRPT